MILPFLAGFLSLRKAPATWALFVLNFIMIAFISVTAPHSQKELEDLARNESFSQIQGRIFANFILTESSRYPANYQSIAQQALVQNSSEKMHLLGMLAMRDSYFYTQIPIRAAGVDPVEFGWWKSKSREFQLTRDTLPAYALGVTEIDSSPTTWMTYQFTHSDWTHFLSNMVVFLIFGSALEVAIGSLGVLVVFLGTGVISAVMFLLIDNVSAVPLIGASGAVSGVIALFCMLYWRVGVRHVYFLFIPRRGYMGFVYLPAWLIFILWASADLAGYLGTPREMGGVAYSAHLGGELSGILVGIAFILFRKWRGVTTVLPDGGVMTGPILSRTS